MRLSLPLTMSVKQIIITSVAHLARNAIEPSESCYTSQDAASFRHLNGPIKTQCSAFYFWHRFSTVRVKSFLNVFNDVAEQ